MLNLEYVKKLPAGVGVSYTSRPNSKNPYTQNALLISRDRGSNGDEALRLVTSTGALSKPLFKNYGKTWGIVKVNVPDEQVLGTAR